MFRLREELLNLKYWKLNSVFYSIKKIVCSGVTGLRRNVFLFVLQQINYKAEKRRKNFSSCTQFVFIKVKKIENI